MMKDMTPIIEQIRDTPLTVLLDTAIVITCILLIISLCAAAATRE